MNTSKDSTGPPERSAREREDLVRLHTEELDHYAYLWHDADARTECGVTENEAAAGLLENMGMLLRYTGDEELRQQFLAMPSERRAALVNAAIDQFIDSPLVETAGILWDDDLLSEASFARVESLFFRRDELSCIVEMMHALVWGDLSRGSHPELMDKFLSLMDLEYKLDRVMRQRPELAAAAAAPLRALARLAVVELDFDRQWWLSDMPVEVARAEEATVTEWFNSLAASVPLSRQLVDMVRRLIDKTLCPDNNLSWAPVTTFSTVAGVRAPVLGYAASAGKLWAQVEGREELRVEIWGAPPGISLCLHGWDRSNGSCFLRLNDALTLPIDKKNCVDILPEQLESAKGLLLEMQDGQKVGEIVPNVED